MALDNTVTITGNATREPELRFTPGGQAVANFGVAVNRRWMNRQTDEWEEAVSFFDVVCWSQLAENTAESVGKGDRVTVTGRLEQQTWEDKETGDNRSKVQIVADDVALSLRWATGEMERNERPDGDSGGGGKRRPAKKAAKKAGARKGKRADMAYNPDEEPF